jgi:CMP-2-keto-3-deoxyoctulosonic acid synthetase
VNAIAKILVDIPEIYRETMENTYENFALLSAALRKMVSKEEKTEQKFTPNSVCFCKVA